MRSLRLGLAKAVCAWALASPALAQDRTPAGAEIVVEGERHLDQRISDFVSALAPSTPSSQLAKFEGAVCPAALGVGAKDREFIEKRLRAVALAVGLEVAPQGCSVNALVMVADNKKAFLETLEQRHPRYLGDLSTRQVERLSRAKGPTAAWQLTGLMSARGTRLNTDGSAGAAGWFNFTTEPASRITAASRPIFDATALVVERRALVGLTAQQFADYAAMRLYARTDPSSVSAQTAPTIMKILDAPMGSAVPLSLTEWDLGFLRGLYRSPNNLYSGAQRSEIGKEIRKQLATPK